MPKQARVTAREYMCNSLEDLLHVRVTTAARTSDRARDVPARVVVRNPRRIIAGVQVRVP
jgi:hypothetical protein